MQIKVTIIFFLLVFTIQNCFAGAITFQKQRDLDFDINISLAIPKTVVVNPVIVNTFGTSARLRAKGDNGRNFTVDLLSSTVNITNANSDSMTVDTFLIGDGSTSGTTYSGTFGGEWYRMIVGATLHIAANQASGTYTGSITALINYDDANWLEFPKFVTINITAVIISNTTISLIRNMDFGNLVSLSVSANYTIDPVLSPTTGLSAEFSINGENNYNYLASILNSSINLTSGGNTMTVDTFLIGDGTTSGSTYSGTFPANGNSVTLYVGATLHVPAWQPGGTYTGSNTFVLNYN